MSDEGMVTNPHCSSLIITHHSLLITHHSSLITHHSLLITHYSSLLVALSQPLARVVRPSSVCAIPLHRNGAERDHASFPLRASRAPLSVDKLQRAPTPWSSLPDLRSQYSARCAHQLFYS